MLFRKKENPRAGKNINIRTTPDVRKEIETRAEAHNLSISEYMLRSALGRPIHKSNTSDLIIELRQLADQQRKLFLSDRRNEHQYMEILVSIVQAIKAVPVRLSNVKKNPS